MIKKRSRKKINFIIIVLTLLLLFILTAIFYIQKNIFSIKSVDINLEKTACIDAEELKKSITFNNDSLPFLNTKEIEDNLKNKYFCVKDANLSKIYPNKVKLLLRGREAFVKLISWKSEATDTADILFEATVSANISDDRGYIADEEGVIFAKDPSSEVVEIYTFGENFQIGQKITDFRMEDIVKVLKTLNNLNISPKRLIMYFEKTIFIDTNPKIFLNRDLDINTQLASLQLILEKAKIDEETIEIIDLRYDKPVVKFAPKNKR